MKLKLNVDKLLALSAGPSKWELDNIVYGDRTSNPETLKLFLHRIKTLESLGKSIADAEKAELEILVELANDLDEKECADLLSTDEDTVQHHYIESLARQSSLEVLCNNRMSVETMTKMCKLSPEDFILASKRTQDLISSIRELIIQGETLSQEVAGA